MLFKGLESLCEKLKECKESENIYLDFLLKSKQSRMKMDEVRKKIDEYEKIFNYLQGLAVDFWIPFPCFQIIKVGKTVFGRGKGKEEEGGFFVFFFCIFF